MVLPTSTHLVWIDLEMTGLDSTRDTILEIAVLITNNDLDIIAQGPCLVIAHSDAVLHIMGSWVKEHHTQSGLVQLVKQSTISMESAQEQVLAFVKQHCPQGSPLLCGNTIWQDRVFLRKDMPTLEKYFHYRMIDVSSVKELIKRWYPHNPHALFKKSDTHRALEDIQESVAELQHYKKYFFHG